MSDWSKVYITNQFHRAEIVIAVLEDHGIEASMIDKRDSSYLFGDIEVFVQEKDIEAARALITDNDL
jgi:transposase InsO family protein